MAYMHPALAEHLRKRWMRPDAYRFAPPGSPEAKMPGYLHPWAEVARQEQAAADEAKARALAEQDEFEREVLALRHELAKLRLEYELRRFQQKYSPDQPRVPAGNSDGGQWTRGGESGGGDGAGHDAGGNDGQVLSDVTPDSIIPGAQYAENATPRKYSVVLADEEAPKGIGHAISRHVGKSDDELMNIVRTDWTRRTIGRFEITDFRLAHGSFPSIESANDFVNRTLEDNREKVDEVASGRKDAETLDKRFGYPTGREAIRPTGDSQPYLRDTYGARVIINHDPRIERGYRVRTAFPINEDSSK
jgi:hypothetical protein